MFLQSSWGIGFQLCNPKCPTVSSTNVNTHSLEEYRMNRDICKNKMSNSQIDSKQGIHGFQNVIRLAWIMAMSCRKRWWTSGWFRPFPHHSASASPAAEHLQNIVEGSWRESTASKSQWLQHGLKPPRISHRQGEKFSLEISLDSRIYPLVNSQNYGKSPSLVGKSTIHGNFQ